MEKWEHELANRVNLHLPESIDQRIDLTIKQLQRKRNKSSKLRYGIAAAAASLVLTFGLSSLSPAFAQALKSLPVIGSVFELVGNVGVKRGSQLQLSREIDGLQVQIEDETVTITESLYDGSNINLGVIVPSDDNDPASFLHNVIYTVDGKSLGNYGSTASFEKLDNGTYAGTIGITAQDALPNSFVLGIKSRDERKTFAEIPVERRGGYQSFTISETRTWNDVEMEYEALTLFPTSTEISFQLRNTDRPFWKFQVYDEQGHVLQPISGYGGGSNEKGHFKYYFEPLETIPKQLTIKPYLSSPDSETKMSGKWKGTPITLSQGKAGSVTVTDETFINNKLTLTYELAGDRIFEQANLIWLEDSKGNQYHKDSIPIRIRGSNKYQMTFSNVSSTDSIYICTSQLITHYLPELAVTMNLQ